MPSIDEVAKFNKQYAHQGYAIGSIQGIFSDKKSTFQQCLARYSDADGGSKRFSPMTFHCTIAYAKTQ